MEHGELSRLGSVEDGECGGVLVVKTGGREHVGDELPLRDAVGARGKEVPVEIFDRAKVYEHQGD